MTAAAAPWLLIYPLLLSLAQFLSDRINIERSKYRQHIASFAAAISITYLLLGLLPETYSAYSGAGAFGVAAFLPVVAGFTMIHLLEKLVYRKFGHRFSLKKLKTYHDDLHAVVLVAYHFAIGLVLVNIFAASQGRGLLFLPPLLLFATIGNWSVHHHYVTQNHFLRLVLASSTTIGGASAIILPSEPVINMLLLGFVAGVLLFVVVRESLPRPKEGNPALFVLGVVLYAALMLLLQ